MAFASFSFAYAKERINDTLIDQDTAITIGIIFVANLLKDMNWDDNTQIDEVIPLYNAEVEITYYYVGLKNSNGEKNGYVVVSTNMNEPLIAEFSDEEDLPVKGELLSEEGFLPIREVPEGVRIYYDSLRCADEPIEPLKTTDEIEMSNSPEDYYYIAQTIVNDIRDQGLSLATGRGFITNPVTYITNNYSGYTYSLTSSHTVSGTFNGYEINDNQGCVVYGTAAILRYYLGNSYSYSTVVNKCKSIAVANNYATTSNYYISNTNTVPFVKKCINYYSLGKTASNTLLSYARTEINNDRPCLINIAYSNQYSDHAVSAFGYKRYKIIRTSNNQSRTLTFYKVKDGFVTTTRYACDDSIVGVYVTKIY